MNKSFLITKIIGQLHSSAIKGTLFSSRSKESGKASAFLTAFVPASHISFASLASGVASFPHTQRLRRPKLVREMLHFLYPSAFHDMHRYGLMGQR